MGNTCLVYKLISLDKIPSTQLYAHELVSSNRAADYTIVMADTQTAGRGRYRRVWVSPRGNLYASFIYKIEERDPKLSYTVAVAIAETLLSFGIESQIKWPNDILVDGKKISGVLIEYSRDFVIIGIGINIESCPDVPEYKTTKIHDYAKINRNELLSVLMKSLDVWKNRNFDSVRKRWMGLAAGLNTIVTHRGNKVELVGINEDGALVLRRGSEYILTYSDEISI